MDTTVLFYSEGPDSPDSRPTTRREPPIGPYAPSVGSTPQTTRSPRLGSSQFDSHARKPSAGASFPRPSVSPLAGVASGLWSTIFPDPNQPLQLPSYRRPHAFRGPAAHQPSVLETLRNVLLRPFYLVQRRGPLLPVVAIVFCILYLTSLSPSFNSQAVKLRVQGAVGPYIPLRAAKAFRKQQGGLFAGSPQAKGPAKEIEDPKVREGLSGFGLPPPRRDGRILIEEGQPHPIFRLMEDGRRQWVELKARQSKTFKQAVAEYVRRYGRRPPKGFDQWYAFAKAHKVLLIDEFDLIDKDFRIFRAFKPSTFRHRVAHLLATIDRTWVINVVRGVPVSEGELWDHDRAKGILKLISRFAHVLPDQKVPYNGHDGARVGVAADERDRLEGLAKLGEFDFGGAPFKPVLVGPDPHWGMQVFCPLDSAARAEGFDYGLPSINLTGYEMPPTEPGSIGTLIRNFKDYLDVCNSPQYRHFHATTSWVYGHHPQPLAPLMTAGVQTTFADIHCLIIEQFDLEVGVDPLWEDRPFASLQWRGQTSGPLWESGTPWRTTQRARLHLLTHSEKGDAKVVSTDYRGMARNGSLPNYRVGPTYFDAGMVGPAVQCIQEDGTCDKMFEVFQGYDKRMTFVKASLFKYVLDIDGNSWSGRFRRLMASNAVVVKATVFTEFWTDWCIPWLHFIPMQVDYSDMWDIMSFFRGGLDGENAHDDLAKEIAVAGKEWVNLCFRWADLETYQFRLMLEYGRLWNDERTPGINDFHGDDSVEPVWDGTVEY